MSELFNGIIYDSEEKYNHAIMGYDAASEKITIELNYKFVEVDTPENSDYVFDKQTGKYIVTVTKPFDNFLNDRDRFIFYKRKDTGNILIIDLLCSMFNYTKYLMCVVNHLNETRIEPKAVMPDRVILEFSESEYNELMYNQYLPSLDELKAMLGGGVDEK